MVSHGAEIVMFEKMSPENSLPFCITTPIFRLSDFKSTPEISLPSKYTAPFCGVSNPSISRMSVDFPQPVVPTIATYCPGRIFSDISSTTSGIFSL